MSVFANSGFQTQPGHLGAPVMAYALWIANHPLANNFLLIALLTAAGVAAWYWRRLGKWRVALYAWLFFVWWFGMDFGYLFSGLGTDPNTPPILFIWLLVAAADHPSGRARPVARRASRRAASINLAAPDDNPRRAP